MHLDRLCHFQLHLRHRDGVTETTHPNIRTLTLTLTLSSLTLTLSSLTLTLSVREL